MLKMGVLTPARSIAPAITNAASVATVLLATDCIIAEEEKPGRRRPLRGGSGGMGGIRRHGRDGWNGRHGVAWGSAAFAGPPDSTDTRAAGRSFEAIAPALSEQTGMAKTSDLLRSSGTRPRRSQAA